ncbi:uncharacterized protein LOC105736643 [Apis florea]|uniref:uncharacterized protein LOC105736643 n=1 Tax=Apis florea TaxID=7463 RepID=UPI000629CB33|nr:uncharacterized protein LOC105736643 [Apis florea]
MKIALIVGLVTMLAGAIAYPAALPAAEQDAVPEEQESPASRPIREANPHRHFGFGGFHGGFGGFGGFPPRFPVGGFGGSHSSAGAISSPFGSAAFASSRAGGFGR